MPQLCLARSAVAQHRLPGSAVAEASSVTHLDDDVQVDAVKSALYLWPGGSLEPPVPASAEDGEWHVLGGRAVASSLHSRPMPMLPLCVYL